MTPETLRFVLQVVAIAVGGGSVQLAIFVLRRRSELRSLDATSGSTALTAANTLITTMQAGAAFDRTEREQLRARIDEADAALRAAQRRATRTIDDLREEGERLAGELARCRATLSVANAEVTELTRQIGFLKGHG